VVVTRARAQASELVKRLTEQGAEVFEFPAIQILPPREPKLLDREIARISDYDWLVFTSANGVGFFFERVKKLGKDARMFSGIKVAAIGEATAEALREKGLVADLVPKTFTSEALFEALKKAGKLRGKNFLLARADIAPPHLRHSLEKEGARVTELETYRTEKETGEKEKLLDFLRQKRVDYVTFTSSSTVRNFFDVLPASLRKNLSARLVSIGPVTSETIREYGFRPAREARVHTIEGLIEVLINGSHR
jgi:uroporphyrinogen III methyltransferase/synthase